MYIDGMGPRESIASELQDTIRFGGIAKIRAASKGYSKMSKGMKSYYMLPFGTSKNLYGYVQIDTPTSIAIHYRVDGLYKTKRTRNVHDAKRFMVQEFISE